MKYKYSKYSARTHINKSEVITGQYILTTDKIPQFLDSQSSLKNYNIKYYDCISLPENLFKRIKTAESENNKFNSFSQWSLEIPRIAYPKIDDNLVQAFSVMEKILTRGRITLCSHELEQELNIFINFDPRNSNTSKIYSQDTQKSPDLYELNKSFIVFNFAHRIQIALLNALENGLLSLERLNKTKIITDINQINLFNNDEARIIVSAAVKDFFSLINRVFKLYRIEKNVSLPKCLFLNEINISSNNNDILLSFTDKRFPGITTIFIKNVNYDCLIATESLKTPPLSSGLNFDKDALLYFLKYLFRFNSFREGQLEALSRILSLKDTILLLPTGLGKSLVYQLASLLMPGCTIIIEPIISLMHDQVENMSQRFGIDRSVAITSEIRSNIIREDIYELLSKGHYIFTFVSPERFQTEDFRNSIKSLTESIPVSLIVIDEAHCISEWGHDFRTSYLNIGRTTKQYCKSGDITPPILALTATASPSVLADIKRELQIYDMSAVITPKTFDRPELNFILKFCDADYKYKILLNILKAELPKYFKINQNDLFKCNEDKTFSGLIFCPHVDGSFGVKYLSDKISEDLHIKTYFYSGRAPDDFKSSYDIHKKEVSLSFKRNKFPLLVCTKSFGMGIDKQNIRYTIHYCLPRSIEAFYQEAGRAGRDGNPAMCFIIASIENKSLLNTLTEPKYTVEQIEILRDLANKDKKDDLTINLYFHTNSFKGVSKDLEAISRVVNFIRPLDIKAVRCIPYNDKDLKYLGLPEKNSLERALYRLLQIGVIYDYTINYSCQYIDVYLSGASKRQIIDSYVNFVGNYLEKRKSIEFNKAINYINLNYYDFLENILKLLLEFVYEQIEKSRRRAFYEMIQACFTSPDDFRKRILNYFEFSGIPKYLDQVIKDEKFTPQIYENLFSLINTESDAEHLRGQTVRYLESYPDHPGLLLIRAISEIFCKNSNLDLVNDHFTSSFISAKVNYEYSDVELAKIFSRALRLVHSKNKDLAYTLMDAILKYADISFVRILIRYLPDYLCDIPAWFLLDKLDKELNLLFSKEVKNEQGKFSESGRDSSQIG